MKKTKIVSLVFVGILMTISAFGQTRKQSKTIPASEIKTVAIQCEGNCGIASSSPGNITIDVTLTTAGTVYGWSKNNAPPFELLTAQRGDTLFISTTPINKVVSIGISTYSEQLEMQIAFPPSVASINLDSKKYITAILSKQHIGSIKCSATQKLIVNDIEKNGEFEFGGIGTQAIILRGEHIDLITN